MERDAFNNGYIKITIGIIVIMFSGILTYNFYQHNGYAQDIDKCRNKETELAIKMVERNELFKIVDKLEITMERNRKEAKEDGEKIVSKLDEIHKLLNRK